MIWCKFCSFIRTTIKFLLNSLPSLLTSLRDGQSQLRIQKLIRPLLLWGYGGGSLKFCNTSGGDQKNFTHTVGGSLKIHKTWKISKGPLPIKNDTSLKHTFVTHPTKISRFSITVTLPPRDTACHPPPKKKFWTCTGMV